MREGQGISEIDLHHTFKEVGLHPLFLVIEFLQMYSNVIGVDAFPLSTIPEPFKAVILLALFPPVFSSDDPQKVFTN